MAGLPQMNNTVRLPVNIPVYPYLFDHCFEGKAVFPAVEAMQILAHSVKSYLPDVDITAITDATFDKFLYIQADTTQIAAFSNVTVFENGDINAVLQTKNKPGKTSITRIKEHATLCFPHTKPVVPDVPLDPLSSGAATGVEITPDQIYRELIPFGPAYQNISENLYVFKDGALAKLRAPANNDRVDTPGHLGSPFVLDAAFHAACAWGQRYARIVAFPVGFEKRIIFKRTRAGETYTSRIIPVRTDPDLLVFDIWIYDEDGTLFEIAGNVHMRDVSAGRLKPPRWIIENGD
jgi:hypothetical protein